MSRIKNYFEKFLVVGLSVFLSCSTLSISINAQENQQNDELSEQELAILDEIYELDPNYTYEGELVSVTKTTQVMETPEDILTSGHALERGAIGSSNMTIYITTSRIKDGNMDTFDINATATWKSVPTVRMQDGFAIAWGGGFALRASSATASYKSMGVVNGKTNQVSMAPNAGIGYSVEASHYYGQALDWVRISARISKGNSSGIANVSAAYCHRTAAIGGIGISFSGDSANIAFSAGGLSDTMSNYTSFPY